MPIQFGDIDTVSFLCEMVAMREDIVPDVSLGTHFFSEMIETGVLYFALFPRRQETRLNVQYFDAADNRLPALLPEAARWAHVVRVIDAAGEGLQPHINANPLKQRVLCYLAETPGPEDRAST